MAPTSTLNTTLTIRKQIVAAFPHFTDVQMSPECDGPRIDYSNYHHAKSLKAIWNEMAMKDIDLYTQDRLEKFCYHAYIEKQMWAIAIIQRKGKFKGCLGFGFGTTKSTAETDAYKTLYMSMNERMGYTELERDDMTLLLAGDVELNPGPSYEISTLLAKKITETDEICRFRLPNDYTFEIKRTHCKEFEGNWYFDTLDDRQASEIIGKIIKMDILSKRVEGTVIPKGRSTIWSNHEQFEPEMRCMIQITNEVRNSIGSNDLIMALDGKSTGCIKFIKNFTFMPSNFLAVRFSKKWKKGHEVSPELYNLVKGSVSNQFMTCQQLASMSSILSTLQLCYLKVPDTYEDIFAFYTMLFDSNMHSLSYGKTYEFSTGDVWKELQELKIIIPTPAMKDASYHTIFLEPSTVFKKRDDFELLFEENTMKTLAIRTIAAMDWKKPVAELIDDYKSGLLTVYTENIKPFRYNNRSDNFRFQEKHPELDDRERFIEFIVRDRLTETNLDRTFARAAQYLLKCDEEFARAMITKMAKLRVDSIYQPGLRNMMRKKTPSIPFANLIEGKPFFQRVQVMNEHCELEIRIAKIAQSEFVAWSAIFGLKAKTMPFANFEFVQYLAEVRRIPIRQCVSDTFDTSTSSDQESYIRKAYNKCKLPFVAGHNFITNISRAAGSVTEIKAIVENTSSFVISQFESCGMKNVATSLVSTDFTSVSSAFSSVQSIINAWFDDFASKVCSLFGVKYERKIEASTLFFYYLVWTKNECNIVRFYILLDIAAKLGILDFFVTLLSRLYTGFKNLIKDPEQMSFDSYMETLKANNQEQKDKIDQTLGDAIKEETVEPAGWIETIMANMKYATPAVLGVCATALVATLGLPSLTGTTNSIGSRVVQTARNVSFLALGLSALPKIYECAMNVFNFVYDYAKALVVKNHTTAIGNVKKITDWLKTSFFVSGFTEKVLVRKLDQCFFFMDKYLEMLELRSVLPQIKDPSLRLEFNNRCRVMEKIYPVAASAIRIAVGQLEVFHIQLYSDAVGVGKTDLAGQVMKMTAQAFEEEEANLRSKMGFKPSFYDRVIEEVSREGSEKVSKMQSNLYPLNDQLKHNDMYFGQHYVYSDEESVMSNTEGDIISQKMMLLSGLPCISQQASLTDKGRMFEIKVLVSNTNNPFAKMAHMLKPQALWRRRELFKVEIRPEVCKKLDGNDVIDEEKLKQTKWNRTKGEHLMITWMEATVSQEKGPDTSKITVPQFLQLAVELAKKHYRTNTLRMAEKDKEQCLMRLQYEATEELMQQAFGTAKKKEYKTECLGAMRNRLIDYWNSDLRNMSSHFENSAAAVQALDDDLFETQKMYISGEDEEFVGYELKESEANGKFQYYVQKTPLTSISKKGKINFANIRVGVRDNFESVIYESLTALPVEEHPCVLYELLDLSSYNTKNEVLARVKSKIRLQNNDTMAQHFKEKLRFVHKRTAEVATSTMKFIADKVFSYISEALLLGISLSLSVLAMFFTLSMVGQILAPPQMSYSGKEKKTLKVPIPMISVTQDHSSEVSLVKKSTYMAFTFMKLAKQKFTMIGLQGSLFLANWHAMKEIKEEAIYIYDHSVGEVDGQGIKKYYVTKSDIKKIPGADAAIVYIHGFRPVRTVFHHFVTEEDLGKDLVNFHFCNAASIMLREDKQSSLNKRFTDSKKEFVTSGYGAGYPTPYNGRDQHDRVFEFTAENKIENGDSGSLVLHDNPLIQRKFLGIILAARLSQTYCGILTQEELKDVIDQFPVEQRIQVNHRPTQCISETNEFYEVFDYPSNVMPTPIPHQAVSKSVGFLESPIFGTFPVETQPAIQDIRDPRIPEDARHFLKVSLNKTNGLHEPEFNTAEEKFMIEHLKHVYSKIPGIAQTRLYDTKHAIIGHRIMGSTSINTKTCAGLPYKLERGVVGKSPMIKYDEAMKTYGIQDRVYDDVQFYEDMYENAKVPHNYKLEFRKKELVPDSKIENPKTRTVATGNMIHQIMYNKLYKDLHIMVKNTWDRGGSTCFALGVDPERHWDQIGQHLKFHDYMVDFDVKAWEEKVCLRLLYMSTKAKLDIIGQAYRSRGQTMPNKAAIAYALAVDYTDAEVIFESVKYRKRNGLLSGHPGTFMENSEIHVMILGLVARRILMRYRPEWATPSFIHEHVRCILAADDIVIAISRLARQYITIEAIVVEYNNLGFEVTAADKSTNIRPKGLDEIQFLKNKFRQSEEGLTPIPNLSIVYQLFNWVRSDTKLTVLDQFKTNIENAFRFLFWQGEETYERIRAVANSALLKHNICWSYDYQTMQSIVQQRILDNEEIATRQITQVDPFDDVFFQ